MSCTQRSAQAKFQVGTSGYMIGKKRWTKLPCLNCIEINSSFYRLPSRKLITALSNLPKNVNVIMKAWRYLTHIKRLKDPELGWEPFWEAIEPLGSKLACVLVQLPPSFANTETNVERLVELRKLVPNGLRVAVEFRNASWLVDSTYDLFKSFDWTIVGTLIIKKSNSKWVGTMPPGLYMPPVTARYNYLRVHGKRGWKGELSEKELLKIRKALGKSGTTHSFVMFNNTFFDKRSQTCRIRDMDLNSAAVCNAVQFTDLLGKTRTRRLRQTSEN